MPKFSEINNLGDYEHSKFLGDSTDEVAVNTVIAGGELKLVGINTAVLITNPTVTDTAAELPATALTLRNSMIIQNRDTTNSIFIGSSIVTATGANQGWEIEAESFYALDITADVDIFAVAASGQSVVVKIMEMA